MITHLNQSARHQQIVWFDYTNGVWLACGTWLWRSVDRREYWITQHITPNDESLQRYRAYPVLGDTALTYDRNRINCLQCLVLP